MDITVVIPTSPIPSHPSTDIVDETIQSVRHHLPDADILLQIDGVHETYSELTDAYTEYKTRILQKCMYEYTNVTPYVFKEHQHQSGMMHQTIEDIRTQYILYVEGDAPLTTDRTIDWASCIQKLEDGSAYTIRFHFEEVIPDAHKQLIIGGNDFLKTIQWSQRPHISTKVYYKDMLKHFPIDARSFIEDYWHGQVMNDYYDNGLQGWFKHRLWIYNKADKLGIKRSYTTDGRQNLHKVGEGF